MVLATVAYHLAKLGIDDVILLERDKLTSETTTMDHLGCCYKIWWVGKKSRPSSRVVTD